jgi:hypothetical protein
VLVASGRESEVMHAAGWARVLDAPVFAVEPPPGDADAPGKGVGRGGPGADAADPFLEGLGELVRSGVAIPIRRDEVAGLLASIAAAARR